MAAQKGGAGGEKKGKKPHKNKLTSKKYKHYVIEAGALKRSRSCPRCGSGVFLAVHKDRVSCGKCKYTEFLKKSS